MNRSALPSAAGHPFRVRQKVKALRRTIRTPRAPRITLADVRQFLLAYCACFLAVSAFIA